MHSLIAKINEGVDSSTKEELNSFVKEYVDSSKCSKIHDDIDSFDAYIKGEGSNFLTQDEKDKFAKMKSEADGEKTKDNPLGIKLRNAGIACGQAKAKILGNFEKTLESDPDSIYKSLCWFNKNKYRTDNVMKSCSVLDTTEKKSEPVVTTNTDTEEKPKSDNSSPINKPDNPQPTIKVDFNNQKDPFYGWQLIEPDVEE